MRGETIAWMQTMTDFGGSPAEAPLARQRLGVRLGCRAQGISLVISNAYGKDPLRLEHVGVQAGRATHAVTFAGKEACSVAPGAQLESDYVNIGVEPGEELVVESMPAPGQRSSTLGSYVDASMARLLEPDGCGDTEGPRYYYGLQAVVAQAIAPVRHVIFFGDSLTNQARFTGPASRALMQTRAGVVACNCGISGNRLLRAGDGGSAWARSFGPSAVDRFRADVTAGGRMAPDAVFALIGANDLFQASGTPEPRGTGADAETDSLPTARELLEGLERLQEEADALGARFIVGTLPPFRGSTSQGAPAWTYEKERVRQTVNAALRSWPHAHVVDVDALVRDPQNPTALETSCDCGDHLHWSACGGAVVAQEVVKAIRRTLAESY